MKLKESLLRDLTRILGWYDRRGWDATEVVVLVGVVVILVVVEFIALQAVTA